MLPKAYEEQLQGGSKMLVSLAGAMSTGNWVKFLLKSSEKDKSTHHFLYGANLKGLDEFAGTLTLQTGAQLPRSYPSRRVGSCWKKGLNRVTDTCMPERGSLSKIGKAHFQDLEGCRRKRRTLFPHEFMYQVLLSGVLEQYYGD